MRLRRYGGEAPAVAAAGELNQRRCPGMRDALLALSAYIVTVWIVTRR